MKIRNIFACFLALIISSCATQEPAPIDYATGIRPLDYYETSNDSKEVVTSSGNIPYDTYEKNNREFEDYPTIYKKETEFSEAKKTENFDLDKELEEIEKELKKPEVIQEKPKAQEKDTIKPSIALGISLIMPVKGEIINKFGEMVDGSEVLGVNIKTEIGDPIYASASGTVAHVGKGGKFGNIIIIKHDNDYQTACAHLDSILVSKGQIVTQGEEIGAAGKTGDVNSPILHFALRKGTSPQNPINFIK